MGHISVITRIILFLLLVVKISAQDPRTPQIWFDNKYLCHCVNGCDSNGICYNESCAPGWFGYKCQYQDLATIELATVYVPDENQSMLLVDRNDSTCYNNDYVIAVAWEIPVPFTWMRMKLSNPGNAHQVTLEFSDYECQNLTISFNQDQTVDIGCDIGCDVEPLIQYVRLIGGGDICSLYINGGRNLALKQITSQTSDYSGLKSDLAVDGLIPSLNGLDIWDTCSCTDLKKNDGAFEIDFPRSKVNRFVIYFTDPLDVRIDANYTLFLQMLDHEIQTFFDCIERPFLKSETFYLGPNMMANKAVISMEFLGVRAVFLCEVEIYGECAPGTYGLECDKQCDIRCYNNTCKPDTGECKFGCYGYYGPFICGKECNQSTWGLNCEQECSGNCYNKHCNNTTGKCEDGCIGYSDPPSCSQICNQSSWGLNCQQNCSDRCYNKSCSHTTGQCNQGCLGYSNPPVCSQECNQGDWGLNCQMNCSNRCYNKHCNRTTGHCIDRCTGHSDPPVCFQVCRQGAYGFNCGSNCSSIHCASVCDNVNGFCSLCDPGYKGSLCVEDYSRLVSVPSGLFLKPHTSIVSATDRSSMEPPQLLTDQSVTMVHMVKIAATIVPDFVRHHVIRLQEFVFLVSLVSRGINVIKNVKMEHGELTVVNFVTQDVSSHSVTSLLACDKNRFGRNCSNHCSNDCQNQQCNKENGTCVECYPGYKGDYCNKTCDNNNYGINCSMQCSQDCKDNHCHNVNGTCEDCYYGYVGDYCNITCDENHFGRNCSNVCSDDCKDQKCNHVTGTCNKCNSGYTGDFCNKTCNVSYYGENCLQTCSLDCRDQLCNTFDGKCVECYIGYMGDFCNIECNYGTWGPRCQTECSKNCSSQNCDAKTGFCIDGCVEGFQSKYCNESMLNTNVVSYYGENCLQTCSLDCRDQLCNTFDGKCVECYIGYMGDFCNIECNYGTWGPRCQTECSINCSSQNCDAKTGFCIEGCVEGFQSKYCNETCNEHHYGRNCLQNCPTSCLNQKCHSESGKCLQCLHWYQGEFCEKEIESNTEGNIQPKSFGIGFSAGLGSLLAIIACVFVIVFLRRRQSKGGNQTSSTNQVYDQTNVLHGDKHTYETVHDYLNNTDEQPYANIGETKNI